MKRIASVFKKSKKTSVAGKDNNSDDTTLKAPRSPLPVSHSTPGLIPGGSSTSSSTVSADLRTPDDDHASNRFPSPSPPSTSRPKKAWIQSWVGSRRSTSSRSIASSEVYEDSRRPEPPPNVPVPPLPRLAQPPPPSTPTQRKQQYTTKAPAPVARLSQDDDATSSESDDDYNEQVVTPRRVHHTPSPSTAISPQTLHKAVMNVRQLTFQSLVPPFSPPPLLHLPGKALFPRSANPLSVLVRQESLRSRTLRAQILRRLDKKPLPAIDARTIAPFANREIGDKHKRSSFILDENAVSGAHTKRIGSSSSGLRRWANRPPFEDRFLVWISNAGHISQMSVATARPGFAVASLELSDEVHLLAGLDHDEVIPTAPTPTGGQTNSRSHRPSPSPLRMEHTGLRSVSSPALVPSAPVTTLSPLSASPSTPTSTSPSSAKLGVRFSTVEDDPSDTVPLGYAQRLHQQRADKARFLQEEEARRHAEEARRMQAERAQWEAERAQWVQERKAEQDARRQRELAEQYVAARERQNRERQGFTPESSRTPSKADISKPEPRRQWSEPNSVRIRRDSSPVSSGPPSVASGRSKYPTPASSVEDVRTRKRSSMNGSEASDRGRSRRTSAISTRPQSYAELPPPLPLDAPLLPPTAPFMQEAGGRSRSGSGSRSRNSPSESPSPALSSSGGSSSGGSQRGSTRGSLYASSRSAEQVSRTVSSPHNYSRPSLHARQSSGSGVSMHSNRPMSVAMPMMYPVAPAAGPATPPAGYWMVPVPMAAYPSPMGIPVQMPVQMHVPAMPPMQMQVPSPAGTMSKRSRQSVIF